MKHTKYFTNLNSVPELSSPEREQLMPVSSKFAFRSNAYYQQLINWTEPQDPIRRIVIPVVEELNDWGDLDASDEKKYTVAPGLEHKYVDTALLLVNDVCGGYCRFCFRKRLFMDGNDEVTRDVTEGLNYIRSHPEITNVVLSGGDPLVMSTRQLEAIIDQIRGIESIKVIRIGTKMPAFNPDRILHDDKLLDLLAGYNTPARRIYMMVHFNHARELTHSARQSLGLLQKAGAITLNQTPLIRGINSDPDALSELFNELSYIGVPPYYVFQCRPTLGNSTYTVLLEEAYGIFLQAQSRCSGLASNARFLMSHATGKVEVVGITNDQVFMRYHRAVSPHDHGRLLTFARNPSAYWLDDYPEFSPSAR